MTQGCSKATGCSLQQRYFSRSPRGLFTRCWALRPCASSKRTMPSILLFLPSWSNAPLLRLAIARKIMSSGPSGRGGVEKAKCRDACTSTRRSERSRGRERQEYGEEEANRVSRQLPWQSEFTSKGLEWIALKPRPNAFVPEPDARKCPGQAGADAQVVRADPRVGRFEAPSRD